MHLCEFRSEIEESTQNCILCVSLCVIEHQLLRENVLSILLQINYLVNEIKLRNLRPSFSYAADTHQLNLYVSVSSWSSNVGSSIQ